MGIEREKRAGHRGEQGRERTNSSQGGRERDREERGIETERGGIEREKKRGKRER